MAAACDGLDSVYEDAGYDLNGFDFDADWDHASNRWLGNDETLASTLNAIDSDLSAFKACGGKLISFHGWADALTDQSSGPCWGCPSMWSINRPRTS